MDMGTIRKQFLKRSSIRKKRSKPRRGRIADRKRLEWAAERPCQVTGEFPATTHHVRSFGSPKDDTRIIRLAPRLHMKTAAVPGTPCIEDGKELFEKFHGVNINRMVEDLRDEYGSLAQAPRLRGAAGKESGFDAAIAVLEGE